MTFVLVPVRFNTPLLLMVIACPANAPPDQVSDPPIVTGVLKLIVPPVNTVMVSFGAGTPTGDQLFALFQFWSTAPVQTVAQGAVAAMPITQTVAAPTCGVKFSAGRKAFGESRRWPGCAMDYLN